MRPPRLRPGDLVALVAPAGPVPPRLVDQALSTVDSWGLEKWVGPCVRGRHPGFGYLSGTDADRAAEFTEAWLRPEVSAVLAVRGGYGCLRMIDLIDWDALAACPPKILGGSSDITVLHEAVATRLGLTTVFAPMLSTDFFDDKAAENLRATLFEPESTLVLATGEELVPGTAKGPTVGGNLSLLAGTIGAPEHRPAEGGIAVLEDITEEPYRLDRFLSQLLRSGWFDGVAGIALGAWTDCGPLDRVKALMADRLAPLGVPIGWDMGFGHLPGSPTIPLGVPATLAGGTLRLDVPALAQVS
ncbi:S66 peptidase family protein [Amycolatopsis suaedae]|uniref:LD-carboxypeptidase n=1 Tax=Amycolatopsis suaedae TaxID=2510978 RepID=A0A4Q7JGU5_9PSEU|nr:LD-carboxypeptidase [Amycolatopsis suaedae]RZQ66144.1 LD-carboxypeptidase [Amycolatopsis suaedae]